MFKQSCVIACLLGVCLAAPSYLEIGSAEVDDDLQPAESASPQFFGGYGGASVGTGGYGLGIGGYSGFGSNNYGGAPGYNGGSYGGYNQGYNPGYGGGILSGVSGYGKINRFGSYGTISLGRPSYGSGYGNYPYYG